MLNRNLKKLTMLRGKATLLLWFEPSHDYVGSAVTEIIYGQVGLIRAGLSAVGLFLGRKSKISHEQNVKEFQFYIRIPNFRLLGSIIKKVPKVADPLQSRTISIISFLYLQSCQGSHSSSRPSAGPLSSSPLLFQPHLISPDDPKVDPSPLINNNNRPRSIFNRGSSPRFIRFVLIARFQMDPLDRRERWALSCSNKGCILLWKILKIKALFEKVSPLMHLSRYPKATVMQLKKFF